MSEHSNELRLAKSVANQINLLRDEIHGRMNTLEAGNARKQDVEKLKAAHEEVLSTLESLETRAKELAKSAREESRETLDEALQEIRSHLELEIASLAATKQQTVSTVEAFGKRLSETLGALDTFQQAVVKQAEQLSEKLGEHVEEAVSEVRQEAAEKVQELEQRVENRMTTFRERLSESLAETIKGIEMPSDRGEEIEAASERVEQVEGQVSEAHESLKALGDELSGLRETLKTDIERLASSNTVQMELDGVRKVSGELTDDIQKLSRALETAKASHAEQEAELKALKASVADIENIAERVIGAHSQVDVWLRGDPGYMAQAFVRHKGGVWQALGVTTEEPGASDDWVLLIDGIQKVSAEQNDRNDGTYVVVHKMASEREYRFDVPFPEIKYQGTWETEKTYGFFDAVVVNGSTYISLKNDNADEPGKSESWLLAGMRGSRGPRGKRWTEDETRDLIIPIAEALTGEEIEKQLFPAIAGMMDTGVGIPLLRYLHMYENNRAYARGEAVTAGNALFIAREDIPADGPPPLALSTTPSPWLTMLVSEGGGAGGGGGSGEANTGQNIGTGEGVFAQKSGITLQFKTLISSDGSINLDGAAQTIDLTKAAGVGAVTQQHTWAISGPYAPGDTIAQMRIRLEPGETCNLDAVSTRNETGTGNITVRKNGTPIAAFSSIAVGAAWADTTGAEPLVTGDYLDFVINSSTGGEDINVTMHKVHK